MTHMAALRASDSSVCVSRRVRRAYSAPSVSRKRSTSFVWYSTCSKQMPQHRKVLSGRVCAYSDFGLWPLAGIRHNAQRGVFGSCRSGARPHA